MAKIDAGSPYVTDNFDFFNCFVGSQFLSVHNIGDKLEKLILIGMKTVSLFTILVLLPHLSNAALNLCHFGAFILFSYFQYLFRL